MRANVALLIQCALYNPRRDSVQSRKHRTQSGRLGAVDAHTPLAIGKLAQ